MAIQSGRLRANSWAVLVVLCLGLFMTLLDVTIVTIAVPAIIEGLEATLDQILWVLNAYTLVFAVLLITAGRLGDLFGPRNLYLLGMALFTAASAICGLAQDPIQLIVGRALQGAGAALLTPQPLAIVLSIFPAERRGAAFGITGAVAGLASLAGPALGGFLVTNWGWRWIFSINLPIGVTAVVLTYFVVPDLRPGRRHRLDLVGVLLATVALTTLTYGLVEGQRFNWGQVWAFVNIPEIIAAGVLALVVFLAVQCWRQDEAREPLVPFEIFRHRNYALMNLVGAAVQFGMVGLYLPITIYLQSVLGLTALQAAVLLIPSSLASMLVAPVAGQLADRFGGKYILMAGLGLFVAGMAIVDWSARPDSAPWAFVPGMIVAGLGTGCIFVPLFHLAMANVSPRMAGAAAGVLNTTRQLGSLIGSATVGAVLQSRLALALHDQAVQHAGQVPAHLRSRFVEAFSDATGGLEVGVGQTGGRVEVPSGIPTDAIQQLQHVAHDVFTTAFVSAMRPTLMLPILVVALAGLSCLALVARGRAPTALEAEQFSSRAEGGAIRSAVGAEHRYACRQ